jgi:hypothetical protein
MTVEINKFLTLKFKFQVKVKGKGHHTTLNLAVVRVYEKGNPWIVLISCRQVLTFLFSINSSGVD